MSKLTLPVFLYISCFVSSANAQTSQDSAKSKKTADSTTQIKKDSLIKNQGNNFEGNDAPDVFDDGYHKQDETVMSAEVPAKFPGGDSAFMNYFRENFNYPPRCADEGISCDILLRFVVDTKGRISEVTVIDSCNTCPEFDAEAVRLLKSSPPWIPGMVKGKFVKSYRILPIRMSIN